VISALLEVMINFVSKFLHAVGSVAVEFASDSVPEGSELVFRRALFLQGVAAINVLPRVL